jgi:P27 family predicted phage terminase small subunit
MGPETRPPDLDREAKRTWEELVGSCDPDLDTELLANYCRQYSSWLAIRSEKARQIKARTFETTVPGRDGSMQLNPLLTAESRLIASLNKMLKQLGLTTSPDDRGARKEPNPTPPGCSGPEPACGWAIELKLCGDALSEGKPNG